MTRLAAVGLTVTVAATNLVAGFVFGRWWSRNEPIQINWTNPLTEGPS